MIKLGQIWANNFNKYMIVELDSDRQMVGYLDTYGDKRTTTVLAFEDFIVNRGGCLLVDGE